MIKLPSFAVAAALLVSIGGVPAHAQTSYDVPTLSIAEVSARSITLQIQAGQSGAPAGFLIEWTTQEAYDLATGWPVSGGPYDPAYICELTGTPTYNPLPDNGSFLVGPHGVVSAEIGDMFGEEGIFTDYNVELEPSTEYVFRVRTLGDAGGEASLFSETTGGATINKESCIHSKGYWKNHPSQWPVASLTLGTVTYNQTQLLAILGQPAHGNGLVMLAQQLIATKLNLANGGSPAQIASYVTAADAQIGSLVVPPIGSGFLSSSSVQTNKNKLDQYNNGNLGATCGPTAVEETSFGTVKTRYR
ncbi:MAG TPA: hypothetical protein VEY91_03035 [Candidatus Limnocylindria bacterium]|nr:hypothetical protein [Candidatus Limnocylindria bacterium]